MPPLKQLNMRAYKAQHGESVIPKGDYCYDSLKMTDRKTEKGLPILDARNCPYWDIDDSQPEQMNGYCWFLEAGDWEEDGTFLLFDQCKECGVNQYEDDEEWRMSELPKD